MPNIKDVAMAAKVSVSTVSRVLNNHPYVEESKRQAVLEAIERLNYSRNVNAVHLIKGKTNLIGVMLPYIHHPFFSALLQGIGQEALRHQVQLIVLQTGYDPEKERQALYMLKMKQIDGLLICSKSLSWEVLAPYSQYGPILACEKTTSPGISSIYIDHYSCIQEAMKLLLKKGHRRIGCCLSREVSPSSYSRRAGFRFPADLAVIGFDNQPIAEVLGITSIDIQVPLMGSTGFALLHEAINDENRPPVSQELPYRLIERAST